LFFDSEYQAISVGIVITGRSAKLSGIGGENIRGVVLKTGISGKIVYCCFLTALLSFSSPAPADTQAMPVLDLAVTIGSVSPVSLPPGSRMKIPVTVTNLGDQAVESANVHFLVSSDDSISMDDELIEVQAVGRITPLGGMGIFWNGVFQQATGTYWIGACVETRSGETRLKNNCSDAVKIVVIDIDLVSVNVDIQPIEIILGRPVVMRAVVLNKGSGATASTTVTYVLSANTSISRSDPALETETIPLLASGSRWVGSSRVVIKATPGTYWIGACIKVLPGETSKENNCSHGTELTILEDAFPDLVADVGIASPALWALGDTIDLYAEVFNIGSAISGPATVSFYISQDMEASDSDLELASQEIPGVAVDGMLGVELIATPQVYTGSYWIRACVADDKNEIDLFNNCSPAQAVDVVDHASLLE
jgi:hypothetical protein